MKNVLKRSLSIILSLTLLLGFSALLSSEARALDGKCGANLTFSLDGDTLTISGTGPMYDYVVRSTSAGYITSAPWYSMTTVIIESGVTNIGKCAFYGCPRLSSVTMPDTVTSIGEKAFNSTPLTSITIPAAVASIGSSAFAYCYYLTEIKFNTRSAADIPQGSHIFTEAGTRGDGIKVTFGNTVERIPAGLFDNGFARPEIRSIVIGKNVSSIGDYAFYGCNGVTSINVPNSVKNIGKKAFCIVPNVAYNGSADGAPWGAKTLNGYVDGCLVFSDRTKSKLTGACGSAEGSVIIPKGTKAVCDEVFRYCLKIKCLYVPKSVKTIEKHAFGLVEKIYYEGTAEDRQNITFSDSTYGSATYNVAWYYGSKTSDVPGPIATAPQSGGESESFFQRVWNWILKYLLFGWIWMK